jgi:transcriptional regulator with XRE-family HTH domain
MSRRPELTPHHRAEARRLRASGVSISDVAERLGVASSTVSRWTRGSSALLPVVVTPPSVPVRSHTELALETPDGFRFVGLDLETAAALWRRLR